MLRRDPVRRSSPLVTISPAARLHTVEISATQPVAHIDSPADDMPESTDAATGAATRAVAISSIDISTALVTSVMPVIGAAAAPTVMTAQIRLRVRATTAQTARGQKRRASADANTKRP